MLVQAVKKAKSSQLVSSGAHWRKWPRCLALRSGNTFPYAPFKVPAAVASAALIRRAPNRKSSGVDNCRSPSAHCSGCPTATPAPTATLVVAAKVAPTGTLNIAYKAKGSFEFHPRLVGGDVAGSRQTLGERVIFLNSASEYVPRIFSEWSTSPDGLVWTFKIQEGIPFHQDYGEVTDEDVIWSFRESERDDSRNAFASFITRLWGIEEGRTTQVDD